MNEMTNLQHHTDNSDQFLPDEAEAGIISEALTRLQAPCPDVDEAWRQMEQTISGGTHARPHVRRWWGVALLAAAVCAGLVFLLRPQAPSAVAGRTVISYEEQLDTAVTVTCNHRSSAVGRTAMPFVPARGASRDVACSMVALKTPRGKDCNLVLADGTRVWLNAESVLEFPERFTGGSRTVSLVGEAYFEVAKDARHPFVVKSPYYTATVLGTSFNAKAYSEQKAEIALVEGSVRVRGAESGREVTLSPGSLLAFSAGHGFSVRSVDTYPYTQRKEGLFYYDNTPLLDIMLDLARWYNKTVVFEDDRSMAMRLHFVAERGEAMADVLRNLGELAGVGISVSEREITIR